MKIWSANTLCMIWLARNIQGFFSFLHYEKEVYISGEPSTKDAWLFTCGSVWARSFKMAISECRKKIEGHRLGTGNKFRKSSRKREVLVLWFIQFSLVTQSCPTLCMHALHGLQHARSPCPSPAPRVYSKPCPLSWWSHPAISSSFILFSSCLKPFPASGSFPMSQFFTSGGQSIGVSASASVLPMNTQDWSRLGWTHGSPCSPRNSQESSPTPQFKTINSLALSFLHSPILTSIHDYWKNHSFD